MQLGPGVGVGVGVGGIGVGLHTPPEQPAEQNCLDASSNKQFENLHTDEPPSHINPAVHAGVGVGTGVGVGVGLHTPPEQPAGQFTHDEGSFEQSANCK
jgi:hypothetical protein